MHARPVPLFPACAVGAALTLVAALGPRPLSAQIEHLDPTTLAALVQEQPACEQQAQGRLKVHLRQVANASPLAIANAVRVANDVARNGDPTGALACYAVPAMSDRMRLTDAYPADGAEVDALLHAADQAMYLIKRGGDAV